jgi:acetyl esterase/lipase
MIQRIVTCIVAFIALAGCSPVALLNHTIPSSGYSAHKAIAYGTHPRQQLDVYVPERANAEHKRPVIVFFYGGSWQWGTKEDYLFVGQAFASRGYVTVIADYRLYPEVYFPAFIEDGALALHWVHDHISRYNGDASNIFLSGHSAGAFITVMLTVNPIYLTNADINPAWVKGTIGISGPYDFLPFIDEDIKAIFSKVKPENSQPVTFVDGVRPPMLLVTGDEDDTVLPRNTYRLVDKLRGFHSPVETHTYEGVGHIGIMLSLARGFRTKTTLLDDIDHFITLNSKNKHIEEK